MCLFTTQFLALVKKSVEQSYTHTQTQTHTHTHTYDDDYRMPPAGSAHRGIMKLSSELKHGASIYDDTYIHRYRISSIKRRSLIRAGPSIHTGCLHSFTLINAGSPSSHHKEGVAGVPRGHTDTMASRKHLSYYTVGTKLQAVKVPLIEP